MGKIIKVYTNQTGYPEKRNIIDLPFKNVRIKKAIDLFKFYTHLYFRIFKKIDYISLRSYFDFGLNKPDLYHFFNTINFTNKSWIITFEQLIPFRSSSYSYLNKMAIKRISHTSCKKVIAISEWSYKIQLNFVKNNYPQYLSSIKDKIIVMHPAQKVLINKYEDKKLDDENIIFTIIGTDFFRKGGLEVLRVFEKLRNTNIKLNIVSSLQYDFFASRTTSMQHDEALNYINGNDNITHYQKLDNNKVLEMLKDTHVVLLPTYSDTYGYSILEGQAAGCPVISTDIRVLPEINNDKVGWIISVPKDEFGTAKLNTEQQVKSFSKILENRLTQIIEEDILTNPSIIKIKGEKSLERIKKDHNPIEKARLLESIYNSIID